MRRKIKGISIKILVLMILLFCMPGCVREEAEIQEEAVVQEEPEIQETKEEPDALQKQQSDVEDEAVSSVMEISPPYWEHIEWAIYSEGIYCYGNGRLCGYLSEKGDEITPCIYEEAMPFSEGLACVYLDGKYGYIGKDGETVLPFIYDQASPFREGVAYFSCGEEYGLIDKEGNVILETPDCDSISSFREGLAYFSVDGQYGYMNKNGEIVVEPVYDDAEYFYEGLAVIMKDGFGGVVGADGREILAPEYIAISTEDTCIIAQKEDRFIFFDTEGNEVSSGAWDWVTRENDIFYIYKDGKKGFADRNGKLILEPIYEVIRPIPEKELVMVQNEKKEYGILDYEGQVKVPFCYYDSVNDFVNGRAVVELNGKYGVLRYDGTLEMPITYDRVRLFSDGSMAVWTGYKVNLTDSQGNLILTGNHEYLSKLGDGYETDYWSSDSDTKFWDAQGNLVSSYDYSEPSSVYGVKNSYILNYGNLLKTGEEDEESLEEVLLINQITPKAGAFKDFSKSGSVTALAGGVPYTEYMKDMKQWKKFIKLYQMGEEDSTVLYFYAESFRPSNFRESNSGLYAVKDSKVEQLLGAGECGGSMRGDWICFWCDEKEGGFKAGTRGSFGGFGGSLGSGDVYNLKNGEMVLENSIKCYHQDTTNYEDETLLENAELFYDEDGKTYTKETILEAETVVEYIVNEKQVSVEDYDAMRKRYRYYSPLQMN